MIRVDGLRDGPTHEEVHLTIPGATWVARSGHATDREPLKGCREERGNRLSEFWKLVITKAGKVGQKHIRGGDDRKVGARIKRSLLRGVTTVRMRPCMAVSNRR